jgi:hypothetical protein
MSQLGKRLYHFPHFPFGNAEFIKALQVEPELSACAEKMSQAQRSISGDRAGRELGAIGKPGNYPTFDLSKDGNQLVVAKNQNDGHQNLWVLDLLRDSEAPLTLEKADHVDPGWSPDDRKFMRQLLGRIYNRQAAYATYPYLTTAPSMG